MKDAELPAARPSRRTLRTMLGPFLVLNIEVGWSLLLVGKFYGRINVPGDPPGYIFFKVDFVGKCLFNGCVQLT